MLDVSDLPRDVIRYGIGLWRRRWLVVTAIWAITLVGWFLVWLIPDKFESRAQVFVQTETILEPVLNGIIAQPNYQKRVEVMRLQLLTRPNVAEIIRRSGMEKQIKTKSEIQRRAQLEKMVDSVADKILIESPRALYFVITYKNGDPIIAREVVDSVLNLLIEQDIGASLSEKEDARRNIEQRIAEFDAKLTAKEREAALYRRTHADELALSQGNVRQRELREAEIVRASDDLSQAGRRLNTLKSLLATTPKTSSGDELDELKVDLAKLRSQYKESYPDIQALKARIEQLKLVGGGALPANQEYIRLQAEIRGVEDSIDEIKARQERVRNEISSLAVTIGDAPAVEAELQRIIRDYEQTQKTYEDLIARRDRLSLTSSFGAGGQGVEYMIFERPTATMAPSDPPRFLLIIGVSILAVVGGVGVGLLFTYLDRSYAQVADLQDGFGLPILGAFGEVKTKHILAARRLDYSRLGCACVGLVIATIGLIYVEVLHLSESPEPGVEIADGNLKGKVR